MNVTNDKLAVKHIEIFVIWFSSFPQVIVSNFGSWQNGYLIVDVIRCVHGFNPKIMREILSVKHDSSHFLQCSIFCVQLLHFIMEQLVQRTHEKSLMKSIILKNWSFRIIFHGQFLCKFFFQFYFLSCAEDIATFFQT